MRLICDTHLLLWAAGAPERLPAEALRLIEDAATTPVFSAASIWEVAIKSTLGRADFEVDAGLLRRGLADNGWEELPVSAAHAAAVAALPPHHRDPFDRMLVAQAQVEGVTLLTSDAALGAYAGAVRVV